MCFEVICKVWVFFIFVCMCDIQMLLPEGIRRENNKMYEEVEIPPNEPMPIGFEEKPVYISELDEVGAIVCLSLFLCVFVHCVDMHVCLYTRVRLQFCFQDWRWHLWSQDGLVNEYVRIESDEKLCLSNVVLLQLWLYATDSVSFHKPFF